MGIFSKSKEQEVDKYVELEMEAEEAGHAKTKVVIQKLDGYPGADKILQNVRNGNIVFARIKELKDTNLDELKSAVSKLKSHIGNLGGDIVGAGDEWLIITPASVVIHREEMK